MYAIFFRNSGKNGIGIVAPENTSEITLYILIIPFESIVNIVNICTITVNTLTSKQDITKAIKNNIKLLIESGSDNLNTLGNEKPIIITGKHLSSDETVFLAIIFT